MKTKNDNLILITDDGSKKTSELLADLKELFSVWNYYTNEELDRNFPPTTTSRWFKNTREVDEELKNKSAETLAKEGIECITLRERLIFDLLYFKETGTHLDVDNITLCAGSRYRDGSVPGVYWDAADVTQSVGAYGLRVARGDLRARVAVSNPFPSTFALFPRI